jgi:hypothetical protein
LYGEKYITEDESYYKNLNVLCSENSNSLELGWKKGEEKEKTRKNTLERRCRKRKSWER